MKLCFRRELILPLFLQQRKSFHQIARATGIAPQTLFRAVSGKPVGAKSIFTIAEALGVNPLEYLANDKEG
jgi:transcriptional regulator with XRE-family HTH domain